MAKVEYIRIYTFDQNTTRQLDGMLWISPIGHGFVRN